MPVTTKPVRTPSPSRANAQPESLSPTQNRAATPPGRTDVTSQSKPLSAGPSNSAQPALQAHQGVSTFSSQATTSTQAAASPTTRVNHQTDDCPELAKPENKLNRPVRPPPALEMNNAACLTHGISPEYVKSALQEGQLSSAFNREGKNGSYSRDADKNFGGALAVYTRAVGTKHARWPSKGLGVGSNESKVQMILSPNVLQDPKHGWRATSVDNGGLVPGAKKADVEGLPLGDPHTRTKDLWGKQTESGRNNAFNGTVAGKTHIAQNEQLHWGKIPLQGNLKGMVVSSRSSFDTLMGLEGAQRTVGAAGRGTIRFGDQDIPVVLAPKNSTLIATLKSANIADANGRVR